MHPAIESFLRGAPFLLEHFGVTLAMLIIGAVIYILITPQQEIKLIREGNTAAALSMGGAIIALALPLGATLSASASSLDIIIWGVLALVIQLIAFMVVDLILKDLSKRINDNEISAAVFLVGVKLGVSIINAAAVGPGAVSQPLG